MKEILLIILCIPLYVLNSFCDKYVSSKGHSGARYNTLKFLVGSICFVPLVFFDDAPAFEMGALLCGSACGVMYAVSKMIILTGYEKTSVAFMTFCHSAGMIVPCVIGHFFWQEKLSLAATVGIALTVFSAVLLKGGKEDKKRYSYLGVAIGIAVFLASGGVMVCQKLMGICFPEESVGAYNFYSFLVPCVIIGLLSFGKKEKNGSAKNVLPFAVGSALSLCIISFVMTSIAGKVPSVIMFPLFNGVGIVLVCIGSVFAFKEKMNLQKAVGIAVGLAGLFLINI